MSLNLFIRAGLTFVFWNLISGFTLCQTNLMLSGAAYVPLDNHRTFLPNGPGVGCAAEGAIGVTRTLHISLGGSFSAFMPKRNWHSSKRMTGFSAGPQFAWRILNRLHLSSVSAMWYQAAWVTDLSSIYNSPIDRRISRWRGWAFQFNHVIHLRKNWFLSINCIRTTDWETDQAIATSQTFLDVGVSYLIGKPFRKMRPHESPSE